VPASQADSRAWKATSSGVVIGQAVYSAVTGVVVDRLGASTALALPAVMAAFVVAAGIAHTTPAPRVDRRPELVRA
jgi:hypothetical protein